MTAITQCLEKNEVQDFVLAGEINEKTTKECVDWILKENANNEFSHLNLYINSGGGEVCSGFSVVNIMKQSKLPVYTYGIGRIMSCGLIIFMAGHRGKRFLNKNTRILSHQLSSEVWGSLSDLKDSLKECEYVQKTIRDHYMDCLNIKDRKEKLRIINEVLLIDNDVYLTPQQLMKYGGADRVVK